MNRISQTKSIEPRSSHVLWVQPLTKMSLFFILSVSFLLNFHQAEAAVNNVYPFLHPGPPLGISYPPYSHSHPPRNTLSNPSMIPVQPLQLNLIPGRISHYPISRGWGRTILPLSECLDDPRFSKGIWTKKSLGFQYYSLILDCPKMKEKYGCDHIPFNFCKKTCEQCGFPRGKI